MGIITDKKNKKWFRRTSRFLLALISIIAIVFFLPREERQTFRYDVGKPWMYGTFIAKFDFPVYKTEEALKQEQDSVIINFVPYYSIDENVEKRNILRFNEIYADGLPGLPLEYKQIIENRLHRIYQSGVISMTDYNELRKDSTKVIRLIKGKNSEIAELDYFFSTRSAYEQLFVADEESKITQDLHNCDLNEFIEPNIIQDKERSKQELEELLDAIPPVNGMKMSGEKIVDRGEIVDEYTARVIASYEKERNRLSLESNDVRDTLMGQIIFVTTFIFLFCGYLALFRRDYFGKHRSMMMLFLLITLFPLLTSFIMKHNFFSVYIIPYCMAPVFIRMFMDARTAFMSHVLTITLCALSVTYQFEFFTIQLAAGVITIHSLREMSSRAQVLKTAVLVTITSCLMYYALQLIQSNELLKLDSDIYIHFIANGILLLLAYPLMYLLEKMFGFSSDITLFELSNTNRGVLRKMSEIAPGTFQHSITVGNLAAEIANKIDANALLVRTGALYHDIGKLVNPVFFTENQAGVNPHSKLSNRQSARMIVEHVTHGIAIADKYDVPSFIKDFILTHHGNGMAKYFYINECNAHPDEEINKDDFTYPGPNPFTREQAILMMADSVEAASRSLQEYSEENIAALVNKIIDSQIADGFFKECPITFLDIAQAKEVLIDRLKNIYHTRIQYPELNK